MSRFIDLTGKVFGRLTVLRLLEPSPARSHWVCRCECGQETFVHGGNLRNGISNSCGCLRAEKLKQPRSSVSLTCPICSKEFRVGKARVKPNSRNCCSRECATKNAVSEGTFAGKNNAAWNGGRQIHKQGYILVRHKGTYILEHRLVMERHLGRELTTEEHVHHKNEIKTDNRIENLELTNAVDHRQLHSQKTWSKHGHLACVECGTTEQEPVTRGLCTRCYDKERYRLKGRRGKSRHSSASPSPTEGSH